MDIAKGWGGVGAASKVLGYMEVYLMYFLGCSKAVLDTSFFLNLPKQKNTPWVFEAGGVGVGGVARPLFWKMLIY